MLPCHYFNYMGPFHIPAYSPDSIDVYEPDLGGFLFPL